MTRLSRITRGAGLAAALIAALAVSACANKPAADSMASAGVATPGSQQDFVVNVGDRVFFETDSSELTPQARSTLDKQAQWLAAVRQLRLYRRRPRRRARHARIQHRARRPSRPGGARLSCRPRRPGFAHAHRSPTARSGRSRSATTFRAGRRTAARSRCSALPHEPLRIAMPSHRRPAGRRFALGRCVKSHTLVLIEPIC